MIPTNEVARYFLFEHATNQALENGWFYFGKLDAEQQQLCIEAAEPRNVRFLVDDEDKCYFVDPMRIPTNRL